MLLWVAGKYMRAEKLLRAGTKRVDRKVIG